MVLRRLLGKPKQKLDAATGDLLVLAQLEKAGADLSRPRELVHYLYAPSNEAGDAAAEELRAQGYAVEVTPAAGLKEGDPNPWLVLARIDAVVNSERVGWERARFEELARK